MMFLNALVSGRLRARLISERLTIWDLKHCVLSVINRPKPAIPHARQLPGGGGILFQLRFRLGGEGSAWDFDLGKVNPGRSPHGHDSVYPTFGGAEQLRSRLGRSRWWDDP